MADTQILILFLAKSLLNPAYDYTLYLDNLFFNISLAIELGKLDIKIMSIAWLNILELPLSFIKLKCGKEILKWGYLRIVIIKRILCFL